jgi:hypothetical protein
MSKIHPTAVSGFGEGTNDLVRRHFFMTDLSKAVW